MQQTTQSLHLSLVCLLVVALALAALPPAAASPQPNALAVLALHPLPGSSGARLGGIAVGGRTVSVVADNGALWRKPDAALSFGPPTAPLPLGPLPETRAAISALPDGGAYLAWADLDTRTITGRRVAPDGSAGTPEQIHRGSAIPVALAVAATADGAVVAVWRDPERLWYRARSSATGGAWANPVPLSAGPGPSRPMLATGPGGQIGLVFGAGDGAIHYGELSGQGFAMTPVTTSSGGAPFDTAPSLTFLPDGTPLVTWERRREGVFLARRQAGGAWPAQRLTASPDAQAPSVAADELGNLVFTWLDQGGSLFVAYQPAGAGSPLAPLVLAAGRGGYRSAQAVANIGDRGLIHIVAEAFTGAGSTMDSILLTPATAHPGSALPIIEGGAAVIGPRPNLAVRFTVVGAPTEARWRWDAPPTDTASDSGGWRPFSSPIAVPAPTLDPHRECTLKTLYTQARSSDAIQAEQVSDSITIDQRVAGTVRLSNPFLPGRAPDDPATAAGALAGEPGYTRAPFVFVEVDGTADCSGLRALSLGAAALDPPILLAEPTFAETLALPNPADLTQGPREVVAGLTDQAGNVLDVTRVITFDSVRPVVAAGAALTVTPEPRATILADLSLSGLAVTDAYPGGYWGAWIATSLTPVDAPATSGALTWTAVAIPAADRSADGAVVRRWSLATGLGTPARDLPSNTTIYVYLRLLDGAGNPSERVLSQQVTLPTVTLPTVSLPLVRR